MKLKLVKQADINLSDINTAIDLKEQYWKHGVESQLNWIKNNLAPLDTHCFLIDDSGETVAYMNVVSVKATFDGVCDEFFGIGNVCVKREYAGKGYAKSLIKKYFESSEALSKPGLLLCHENLCDFYTKLGWVIQTYKTAYVGNGRYSLYIMTLGYGKDKECKAIFIDKNF